LSTSAVDSATRCARLTIGRFDVDFNFDLTGVDQNPWSDGAAGKRPRRGGRSASVTRTFSPIDRQRVDIIISSLCTHSAGRHPLIRFISDGGKPYCWFVNDLRRNVISLSPLFRCIIGVRWGFSRDSSSMTGRFSIACGFRRTVIAASPMPQAFSPK